MPPLVGNPLEFGVEIWRQKTRIMWLPDDDRFDSVQARDRQTDGSPIPLVFVG